MKVWGGDNSTGQRSWLLLATVLAGAEVMYRYRSGDFNLDLITHAFDFVSDLQLKGMRWYLAEKSCLVLFKAKTLKSLKVVKSVNVWYDVR